MSSVTADSFGDLVPEPRSPLTRGQVDVRDKPSPVDPRPLVQTSPTYGQEPDIGKWPVSNGFALDWPRYSKGQYAEEQRGAEKAEHGIWRGQIRHLRIVFHLVAP